MTNIIQLRNTGGFTRMDNSLMDALMAIELPGREIKVALFIAKATLNFQAGASRIKATEVAKATNIHPDVASKAIAHLLKRRVIFREGGARGDIGLSDPKEWIYFECPNRTISSESDQNCKVIQIASQTKSDDSLLYSKKEPLVTVPTEQNTAPQGGEVTQIEKTSGVSFNGEDFEVSSDLITKWATAYAPVDVETEISRAAAWAAGAKAKKDYRRFLVNWLAKAHRKAANGVSETNVPVDQIIDLYHRVCPNLPVVTVKTDKALRSMIVERWNEAEDHQSGKGFWLPFFEKANNRSQVFYRGQNVVPRLEALVSRAVFREISEARA